MISNALSTTVNQSLDEPEGAVNTCLGDLSIGKMWCTGCLPYFVELRNPKRENFMEVVFNGIKNIQMHTEK